MHALVTNFRLKKSTMQSLRKVSEITRLISRVSYSLSLFIFLISCSVSRQIGSWAKDDILNDTAVESAHVGISVYDPASSKYLYNYQGNKYFVPASNTKLFSLYAGMKLLGDSLTGIFYAEVDTAVFLLPTGDPSLLHPDFISQPVIDFLKKINKKIYVLDNNWKDQALGAGWSWDDYNDDYSAERSPLPVYGNVIRWVQEKQKQENQVADTNLSPIVYSIPDVNWKVLFTPGNGKNFFVQRRKDDNIFQITESNEPHREQNTPFVTHGLESAIELLKDTIGKEIFITKQVPDLNKAKTTRFVAQAGAVDITSNKKPGDSFTRLCSRPVDSVFIPMMHRSDNFFAEQTLLMVSNEKLGIMNDEQIIDTLLKNYLKGLPQKPNWTDGSGLSRYNLFTPQDFVWLLDEMKDEFGMKRMKTILPTGGNGTLGNYYKQDSGYIYAKTGSLSGVICLSGYLYTEKNHLLIFSVLVNNHNVRPGAIRRAVEKFIVRLRETY